jgi:hypothetical protein
MSQSCHVTGRLQDFKVIFSYEYIQNVTGSSEGLYIKLIIQLYLQD